MTKLTSSQSDGARSGDALVVADSDELLPDLSSAMRALAKQLWSVPRQREQGTIWGGSGSAVRMRIVPRPRQVGHTEDMGSAWVRKCGRVACSRAWRAVNFCNALFRSFSLCLSLRAAKMLGARKCVQA